MIFVHHEDETGFIAVFPARRVYPDPEGQQFGIWLELASGRHLHLANGRVRTEDGDWHAVTEYPIT